MFAPDVYAQRLGRAQQLAAEKGLAGLLVTAGADLAYLTGSWISTHERLTVLAIPAQGTPTLVLPAVDRGDLAKSAIPQLNINVSGWEDGDAPHRTALAALNIGASKNPSETAIGVAASMTADHLLTFMDIQPASYQLATYVLKELFTRKDQAEIEQLRGAGAAIDRVHAQVPGLIKAGRSEKEVAADLEQLILQEHSAVDFIIVGSQENGANPHHDFSDRVLEPGDVVVVDIGGTFGPGYHSDCTRTYQVAGAEPDAETVQFYRVLREAQEKAVQAVRPGVKAADIDALCRTAITDAGYGEAFIHRTGHGIGLSTHEEPFIMAGNDLVLEPGMAFSIEPGIYLEGRVGARIEDIVVVTETGCERLNNQPRDLVVGEK